MKKEHLNDINKEIYEIFKNYGIEEHEMLSVYKNCFNDFELNFQVSLQIENKYLNMIRDTVWYNFEHRDEKDLSRWGSVFSHFMFMCDDDDFIEYEEVHPIIGELNDIKTRINSERTFIACLAGSDELFNDKNSKINFIDKRKQRLFENDKINSKEITCYVSEEIGSYEFEKIKINSLIDEFLNVLRRAETNQSRIGVSFI